MKKLVVPALLCFALAACGVKPGSVDPPEGAERSKFPRTYPSPATNSAPKDNF
jgi:hypothetical protein